jgi:hypothetical protein
MTIEFYISKSNHDEMSLVPDMAFNPVELHPLITKRAQYTAPTVSAARSISLINIIISNIKPGYANVIEINLTENTHQSKKDVVLALSEVLKGVPQLQSLTRTCVIITGYHPRNIELEHGSLYFCEDYAEIIGRLNATLPNVYKTETKEDQPMEREPIKDDTVKNEIILPAIDLIQSRIHSGKFSVLNHDIRLDFIKNPLELHYHQRPYLFELLTVMSAPHANGTYRKAYTANVIALPYASPDAVSINGVIRYVVEYEGKTYYTQVERKQQCGQPGPDLWWLLLIEANLDDIEHVPDFDCDSITYKFQ